MALELKKENILKILQEGYIIALKWLPDDLYLSLTYRIKMGERLNLSNPKTLNEKLQWLKLHDRRKKYIKMVDKYEMKKYVSKRIGKEYVVPTLGVWDHFDDIDFKELPEKFVLKCTHDSRSIVICTNKDTFDKGKAKEKLEKKLKKNQFWHSREWPYKGVKPRIIAEPYLIDESGKELKDYKIFCFNGRPDYVEVDFNRFVEHKLNPYDFDWNPLNFCDTSKNDYEANIPKPMRLNDMKEIAEVLSSDIPFIRVDFYSIYDKIYVGELTLYPASGFIRYNPEYVDLQMGNKLSLPAKK